MVHSKFLKYTSTMALNYQQLNLNLDKPNSTFRQDRSIRVLDVFSSRKDHRKLMVLVTSCHPKKLLIRHWPNREVSQVDTCLCVLFFSGPKKTPNWADFPTAALSHPLGIVVLSLIGTPIHVTPVRMDFFWEPRVCEQNPTA